MHKRQNMSTHTVYCKQCSRPIITCSCLCRFCWPYTCAVVKSDRPCLLVRYVPTYSPQSFLAVLRNKAKAEGAHGHGYRAITICDWSIQMWLLRTLATSIVKQLVPKRQKVQRCVPFRVVVSILEWTGCQVGGNIRESVDSLCKDITNTHKIACLV